VPITILTAICPMSSGFSQSREKAFRATFLLSVQLR